MTDFVADPACCLRTPVSQGGEPIRCAIIDSKANMERFIIMGKGKKAKKKRMDSEAAAASADFTERMDKQDADAHKGRANGCAGRSIREIYDDELDIVIERLMTGEDAEAADGRDPGRAEGIAWCIAVIQNPYLPSIPAVKDAAMERYYAAHPEEEEEDA